MTGETPGRIDESEPHMPNGFHDDPSIDQIFHRHTEHGHFKFHTYRGSMGFISVHLEHDRGYAYEPLWDTLDLGPFVRCGRARPTRAEMEARTAELISQLVALQASNLASRVHADRASALLLLAGWCVVLGGYEVYTRRPGEPFLQVVPPMGSRCDDSLRRFIAADPSYHYLARATHVHAVGGSMFHTPGECVYDLEGVTELLASTAPLHEHPGWSALASAPIDSVEANGLMVTAMRDEAVAHGSDHVIIRWRETPR